MKEGNKATGRDLPRVFGLAILPSLGAHRGLTTQYFRRFPVK
ncbi:hypothetical protein E2C01_084435 [Portunus trituberculatus]|uniref:Uncharacterized protein n=1 Tax=Portunus trituberculatus TaxID=210409 RepID=A0A5B7JAR3_PORTR|nr:hypothetical protein [Portunus trituberculatus]